MEKKNSDDKICKIKSFVFIKRIKAKRQQVLLAYNQLTILYTAAYVTSMSRLFVYLPYFCFY